MGQEKQTGILPEGQSQFRWSKSFLLGVHKILWGGADFLYVILRETTLRVSVKKLGHFKSGKGVDFTIFFNKSPNKILIPQKKHFVPTLQMSQRFAHPPFGIPLLKLL